MPDLTDHLLAEWQRLADEATTGPWRVQECPESESEAIAGAWDVEGAGGVDVALDLDRPADAAFIAAARTAVPALIAEVRRLREEAQLHQAQDATITELREETRRLHDAYHQHHVNSLTRMARLERLATRLWASRRRWQSVADEWRDTAGDSDGVADEYRLHAGAMAGRAHAAEAHAAELRMSIAARDKALDRTRRTIAALWHSRRRWMEEARQAVTWMPAAQFDALVEAETDAAHHQRLAAEHTLARARALLDELEQASLDNPCDSVALAALDRIRELLEGDAR